MATETVAITSYSAEVGLVGHKPQFNGDPASLFGAAAAVAPERFYMEGGTIKHEAPFAPAVVPLKAAEPVVAS